MDKQYKVKMQINRIDGGIPLHPNMITAWLSKNGIQDDENLAEKIATNAISEDELEEKLAKITTTFITDTKGNACIEARCIKAGIKQAAGVMGLYGMVPGLRELIKEGLEVYPELIPLAKKDALKTETKAIHVEVQGRPQNALTRTKYLEDVTMEFEVHVTDREAFKELFKAKNIRKNATLTVEQLQAIIEYGSKYTGWGANRSQRRGKAEVLSVEEIQK
jgi:hypothetical protein